MRYRKACASIAPMDKDTKLYEIAYLITPAFTEDEARDFHQKIKNEVLELGGLMDHEGDIKKRRLSYHIAKMGDAYLASFRVMLPREKASQLKTALLRKEILRSLMVLTGRNPVRSLQTKPLHKTTTAESTEPVVMEIPETPAESQAKIEEIDKKLEEILGA